MDGALTVAIVTGASVGIGRACAISLAEAGYDIGVTFRGRQVEAREVVSAIRTRGRSVALRRIDFADDPDETRSQMEDLIAETGAPDALVNNAGISPRAGLLGENATNFERTLRINVTAPFVLAQSAAQAMIRVGTRGSIVNVTSILAQLPLAECGSYCASKAALAHHTRVMAIELTPYGIRVNAVAPGHTATPMNYGTGARVAESQEWTAIPMRRPARPAEIAAAVRFLASERAGYVTGATLTVDGGLSLPNGAGALQEEMGLPPAPASLAPGSD